jgi:AcrR family transcriptional regulator
LSIGGFNCDDGGEDGAVSRLRAARRRRILESAERTFLRDGYRHATMERIAEDASVSKQTLYNYFADKESLFASLLKLRHSEKPIAEIEAALCSIADPDGDAEAGLYAAAEALFRFAVIPETRALHRLIVEVTADFPQMMLSLRRRFFLQRVEAVRAALERGADAGKLRRVDAELAAYFFFGIAAAHSLHMTDEADEYSVSLTPQRMGRALADIFGNGLIAGHDREVGSPEPDLL